MNRLRAENRKRWERDMKDFINILDFDGTTLMRMIDKAIGDKALLKQGVLPQVMQGKTLALYFEKPSLRTRVSFEVAANQLGGRGMYMTEAEIGLGRREPVKDVARVMSGMVDGMVTRTFSHSAIEELAKHATIPIVNALSDHSHPCQAMADLMTAKEKFGQLAGLKLAFIGDGNNVARSLAEACARLSMTFAIATPHGFELDRPFVETLRDAEPNAKFIESHDAREATSGADVVYTDTWISMGQEKDREAKVKAFAGFQVNTDLMRLAKPGAIVMHCLPAYRGYEITDEVMECAQSVVFDEAENRLHFQRALLALLVGKDKL